MPSEPALTWEEGNRLILEVGSERYIGERVQAERKLRGWSQAELARQLKLIEHPIHQSAISKIEPLDTERSTGRPRTDKREARRGVTLGEAIGFAKVFGIPVVELLLPPDSATQAAAWRSFLEAADYRNDIRNATNRYEAKLLGLREDARYSAEFTKRLRAYRDEVMASVENQLREQFNQDNELLVMEGKRKERWPGRAWVGRHRPPAVIVIDDILGGSDD